MPKIGKGWAFFREMNFSLKFTPIVKHALSSPAFKDGEWALIEHSHKAAGSGIIDAYGEEEWWNLFGIRRLSKEWQSMGYWWADGAWTLKNRCDGTVSDVDSDDNGPFNVDGVTYGTWADLEEAGYVNLCGQWKLVDEWNRLGWWLIDGEWSLKGR